MTSLPFLSFLRTIILVGLVSLITACFGPHVNYQAGWTTEHIQGAVLDRNGDPLKDEIFIVVKEFFSRFVDYSDQQPLYLPRARLIYPGPDGQYDIKFDWRATRIELSFISAGYSLEQFRFERQLGVGNLYYTAVLEPGPGWKEHFLLQIVPFLESFIIDQRFKKPETHQLFLGDWMDTHRELFIEKLHSNN